MIDSGIDRRGSSLRLLIAEALRSYPTASLYPFLEDRSVPVRTAAAREIQVRGEAESFAYATQLATDRRSYVREIAIFILGQHGTPSYPFKSDAIPLLASKLSHDPAGSVRAAAAAGLGHLKGYEAIEALVSAVGDRSFEVRACVASALSNMKRSAKARAALLLLKEDVNEDVRRWAID
nr:HEAT repeat domain-containing protein [uncultured Duganella sp.]